MPDRAAAQELTTIKGTKNGLLICLHAQTSSELIKIDLHNKLQAGNGFFTGANYSFHAPHPLDDCLLAERHQICAGYGLMPAETEIIPPKRTAVKQPHIRPVPDQPKDTVEKADTLLVDKSIRSGNKLSHDGHIVILGDVNPGAEVTATGNILVMGALRGTAHAGCTGDINAVIMAIKLYPSQLRIADKIARSPENLTERPYPELAYATEKEGIVIEKYNPNKRR